VKNEPQRPRGILSPIFDRSDDRPQPEKPASVPIVNRYIAHVIVPETATLH